MSALPFLARLLLALAACLFFTDTAKAQRPTKPTDLVNYFTGNTTDSPRSPVGGPAIIMMGGGGEVDFTFRTRAYPIINGGDIVVIRATGTNGYQTYFSTGIVSTGALVPNSVETLVINTRAKAGYAYSVYAVERAEMVWFAGGDQSDYVNNIQGTALETAIRTAYARGAVIGGTSAGANIMSEWTYDPDGITAIISTDAVTNPYNPAVIIATNFLGLPLGFNLICDPHFQNRNRMGRLLTFMARLRQDARTSEVIGVGINEDTSLFISATGQGVVDGSSSVFIIREDRRTTLRTQVASGQRLIYQNLQRTKLVANDTFNFKTFLSNKAPISLSVNATSSTSESVIYAPLTSPY